MASRLPTPGADDNNWGTILNDFLNQAHGPDGTLKSNSVDSTQLQDNAITNAKLDATTQDSLTKADSAYQKPGSGIPSTDLDAATQTSLGKANSSLQTSNNLSELTGTATTARTNLGLGTAATMTPATLAANSAFTGSYVSQAAYAPQADDVFGVLLNPPQGLSLQNTPVVTWATSAQIATPVITYPAIVNTGTSKSAWDGRATPTDSVFWFDGGSFSTANGGSGDLEMHPDLMPGGSSQAAYWTMSFEFVTSSVAQFEMEIYAVGSYGFKIEVNGIPMGSYDYMLGSSLEYVLFTFPVAAGRHIRITGEFLRFRSIRVPAGGSLSKPSMTRRTGILIGDSWAGGSGAIGVPGMGVGRLGTYASQLLRVMGATERINMGIGGTGFVTGGSTNAYYTRIAAALTKSPSFMVFQGSQNDTASSVATIQAAIENVLSLTDAVSERYVLTSFWADASQPNVNAAVRAAVAAHGNNVKLVDVAGSISGSGNIASSPVGTRGLFIGTDNAHPTIQGHSYLARRAFRLISPYLGY